MSERGSEKALNECLEVNHIFPSAAWVQLRFMRWQVYHITMLAGKAVRLQHRLVLRIDPNHVSIPPNQNGTMAKDG